MPYALGMNGHGSSSLIDDAFGSWLAGFFDGEGSFTIHRSPGWAYLYCRARINLRADDLPLLREIRRKTGIGSITGPHANTGSTRNSNPQGTWTLQNKADCGALREIFRHHPLRSKKQRDFIVWSEALDAWSRRDWPAMERLKLELQDGRRWVEEDYQAELALAPGPDQLSLMG